MIFNEVKYVKTKLCDFSDPEIIDIIRNEEVLAFPTETVFGLGVIYDSKEAFERLVQIKQRRPDKPFTIMLASSKDIDRFVDLTEEQNRLVKTFMPGEITLLMKPKTGLYEWVTLNQPTIGIRVSASQNVCDMIARVGKPMLVTSCNKSGKNPALSHKDALKQFDGELKIVVKGKSVSKVASTIVLCVDEKLKLIREGGIPFDKIEKVWKGESL